MKGLDINNLKDRAFEADNLGPDAVKELEKYLLNFRKYFNGKKQSSSVHCNSNAGKNVPMTQGKYTGNVKRLYNTHHM